MESGRENLAGRQLKTFGWQGVRFTVPEDWSLVRAQGDYGDGYLRLADEVRPRVDLRWEKPPKEVNPSEAINRYTTKLVKKAKKEKIVYSLQRDLNLASLKGKKTECYRWSADVQSVGLMSYCEECGRLVHVHVLGTPQESLRKVARRIFASLKDHPEDGKSLWRFYDVEFETPEDMLLQRQELKTGCIRMLFSARGRELEFVKFSLARMLLADKTLREWFEDHYARTLGKYRHRIVERQIAGHAGLVVEGTLSLLRSPAGLFRRRRMIQVACWHCADTNRLFVCGYKFRHGDSEVFEEAVESFRCCSRRGGE